MKPILAVQLEAEADFENAIEWYEAQRPGLGAEFAIRVRQRIARILEFPEAYRIIGKGVRKARVVKFPYGIFYRFSRNTAHLRNLSR